MLDSSQKSHFPIKYQVVILTLLHFFDMNGSLIWAAIKLATHLNQNYTLDPLNNAFMTVEY